MPPAKKRTRTYDPAKIRTAVLAQFGHVREAVARPHARAARRCRPGSGTGPYGSWPRTSPWPLGAVGRYLDEPAPPKRDVALLDWPFATAAAAGHIAEDTRELRRRADLASSPPAPPTAGRSAPAGLAGRGPAAADPVRRDDPRRLPGHPHRRTRRPHRRPERRRPGPRHPVRPPGPRRLHPPARRRPRREGPRRRPPRCGCRRTPWSSASRAPGTPGAPRRTSSRPTR